MAPWDFVGNAGESIGNVGSNTVGALGENIGNWGSNTVGSLGENIGGWGSNVNVPGALGVSGGGGAAPGGYQTQPWQYSQGQPAFPNPTYGSDAKTWGQQQALWSGTINMQPQMIQNQMERQQAGVGIMGALAGQTQETGYLNQNYDIGQRQLANEQGRLDVDRTALGRQPGLLNTLHGIAGQGFDLTRAGQAAQANQSRRQLESGLTGRGAFTSVGGQQGRYDIATDLVRQTQGTNLAQQGETAHYFESMAQVGDQNKKLDLAASDLGISRDQLKNHLQQGLERLNLSTATSVADLTNKITSSDLQEAAMGRKIWNDALQQGGYFERLYPGQEAAKGSYGPEGSGTEKVYGGRR